jgi:hypothetical protein
MVTFNKKSYFIFSIFFFVGLIGYSQEPAIKIFLPQYGTYFDLPHHYKIGDTITWKISKDKIVRIVFYNQMGKSFSEAFENGTLIEKGYYENSLDTLKTYSSPYRRGKRGPIRVLRYFEPVKNGLWLEFRGKRLREVNYKLGEEL